MKNRILSLALLFLLPLLLAGCKKDFLNRAPSNYVDSGTLFNEENGPENVLNGIHSMLYTYGFGQFFGSGLNSLNIQVDFLSDLYINSKPAYYMGVYRWEDHISPNGTLPYNVWDMMYTIISHSNQIIQFSALEKFSSEGRYHQVMAEAYTFRAFAMNYLAQCFSPRYKMGENNSALGIVLRVEEKLEPQARGTLEETYAQIEKDIKAAMEHYTKAETTKGLLDPVQNKDRITLSTANGIFARIYLYKGDYASALKYATDAITIAQASGIKLQEGVDLLDGFNNSDASEWMWGYKQAEDQNMFFGAFGAHYSYNFNKVKAPSLAINRSYYDKMGKQDVRRRWFIARDFNENGELPPLMEMWNFLPSLDLISQFLFKPSPGSKLPGWEYTGQQIKFETIGGAGSSVMNSLFMRLGEMYYIKAEAEARLGKIADAGATLEKVLITRDPEYKVDATLTADALADEILRNKWIDLYYEGGVFFDMKRLDRVPNRLGSGNDKYMDAGDSKVFVTRNSDSNARMIPTKPGTKAWVFALPDSEIKNTNKLVEQNPL